MVIKAWRLEDDRFVRADDLTVEYASECPRRLRVEGLSPRQWLQRCASAWPEDYMLVCDGIDAYGDGNSLLEELSARFTAYDEWLGSTPNTLDHRDVAVQRLLLGSLKKFRCPGDAARLSSEAVEAFVKNNADAASGKIPKRFVRGMREFLNKVLADFADIDADPHFGPGAVYESVSVPERWSRIFDDFSSSDEGDSDYDPTDPGWYHSPYWRHGGLKHPHVARLCAVPKDWNKMRLITVESIWSSYLQHWTRERLLKALKLKGTADLKRLACPKRRDPQLAHRALAQRGSVDGSLATLDLSSASDLVSVNQVIEVFPPWVIGDLLRARSDSYESKTPLPNGTRPSGDIFMYAGMGNATTFVVETLMFHAACYAICDYYRLGFKDSFISCYGDDMVVSEKLASLILDLNLFEEFGWRINRGKSFWRPGTRFRESCGGQYYAGHDVTILRYGGHYSGCGGLVAYADLINRVAGNPRWWPLTLCQGPWKESPFENSTRWRVEGGLLTSVPFWPDTCSAPLRCNRDLARPEVKLPMVHIPEVVVPTGLGSVYGALSGQLATLTGHRRIHGRKAYGILLPHPRRIRVVDGWLAVHPLE